MIEARNKVGGGKDGTRIEYIDIAKMLGIIFVIAGHVVSSNTEFKRVIYAFHMPLFFMLSGMLLKVERKYNIVTWRKIIEKKLMSLIIPYIIWGLIYSSFSIRHLVLILYGTRETLFMAESLTSLWFLPVMFVAFMIAELVLQISTKKWKNRKTIVMFGVVVCFLIGVFFPHDMTYGNPWGIDIAFVAAAFMLLGMLIKKELERFSKKSGLIAVAIILALIFLVTARYSDSSVGYVLMANAIYGNPIIFLINSVVGSMIVIIASILMFIYIYRTCALSWIGARTLGIFVVHKPVVEVCQAVVTQMGQSFDNPIAVVGITFVALIVSVVVIAVIERVMPSLIGLKNK